MDFDQFLVRQGRTKVGIAGLQQFPRLGFGFIWQLVIARSSAFLGSESLSPLQFDQALQAFDLTDTDT